MFGFNDMVKFLWSFLIVLPLVQIIHVSGHNKPSLKLFEKHGFAEWGLFPGIAEMDGKRYDLKILGRELS